MKLKITDQAIGPGVGLGKDNSGEEFLVLGGDLCRGMTVDVNPHESRENIFIVSKVDYEHIDHFDQYFDDDGLIEFSTLREVKVFSRPFHRVCELDGFWVFVERKAKELVEYMYENQLIENSKLRITKSWAAGIGGVPVYSVNYDKLIRKVISEKNPISSWYVCNREKDFDKGVYADLFVLGNINKRDLQIQLWQIIGDGDEVLYAHGFIDMDTMKFSHFDLASHFVDPIEIPLLIYQKRKMALIEKKKWIRIDNQMDETSVFDLIKLFFPLDGLVDEFKEYPVPNPAAHPLLNRNGVRLSPRPQETCTL